MISPVERWTAQRTGLGAALDAATLLGWQSERLREVVTYAREHGSFYGERLRGIDPASLSSPADLARLPFTWPADVARDPLSFLCVPPREVARLTTLTTSGTGGVRKRIGFTLADLERTVAFFAVGMQELVSAGQHVLILMPGESEHSLGRLLQTALGRIDVSAQIGGRDGGIDEVRQAARRADCVVGIPGEVAYLCRADGGLRPRSVLLSADYVPRSVIAAIAETWHCPVFTHYGMTETGFGCAVQCAVREGHHLRDADLLVEIIDPQTEVPLPAGAEGEIVVTTWCHQAMPLIRYRTGDVGRVLAGPCACGGLLPRLGRVAGRRENEIALDEGQTLSIHQLDEWLFARPGVRGFTAELRRTGGRNVLHLTLAAARPLEPEILQAELPAGLELELRYAEIDPFASRAKRRIQVRESGDGR